MRNGSIGARKLGSCREVAEISSKDVEIRKGNLDNQH